MKTRLHGRLIASTIALCALAQVKTEVPPVVPGAPPATLDRIKIHGAALEGNLEGNDVDREVLVFLPPSYATEITRHYPVVYALHGYSIGASQWSQEIHVPQTIEGAFAQGAQEMIVVLPDSKTVHNGSMYSRSVTLAISSSLSPTMWSPTSIRITALSPPVRAAGWSATPWAVTAPAVSA
jgi:hypothetical protein